MSRIFSYPGAGVAPSPGGSCAKGITRQKTKYWPDFAMRLKTWSVSASLNQVGSVCRKNISKETTCTMSARRVISNGKHLLRSRFATSIGTNPEKLFAAALCSCFSKALIKALEISGFHADSFKTTATVGVTRVQIDVHTSVWRE